VIMSTSEVILVKRNGKFMMVKNMRSLALAVALVSAVGIASTTWAQTTITTYDFTNALGNQASTTASLVAGNMTADPISRGPGLSLSAGADSISAGNWTTAGTIDLSDYYTFTLTPATGFGLDLNTIEFSDRRSATAPLNMAIRSSLDAFAGDITTLTLANDTSFHRQIITLGPAFDGITSAVEFRLYGYNAGNSLGTLRIGGDGSVGTPNNLIVTGAVIPEPTTLALLSLGAVGLVARRRKK
jgi:hypothetical protein